MQTNDPLSMLLSFLFLGGGLTWLGNGLKNYFNGRATAEKSRNREAIRDAASNERRADMEAENRRDYAEWASQLLRIIYKHGIDQKEEIPPEPDLRKCPNNPHN